jgi:hypothetical protein
MKTDIRLEEVYPELDKMRARARKREYTANGLTAALIVSATAAFLLMLFTLVWLFTQGVQAIQSLFDAGDVKLTRFSEALAAAIRLLI